MSLIAHFPNDSLVFEKERPLNRFHLCVKRFKTFNTVQKKTKTANNIIFLNMADVAGARSGVKHGDTKKVREIDHVVAWSFGNAKDLPEGTVSRCWVAKFIKRSETFVKRHWNINPYDILLNEEKDDDEQRALSQESKEVVRNILSRPKKGSVHKIMEELQRKRKKKHSYGTVYRFLKSEKARAFHIVSKPRISQQSAANRLAFCEFLGDWDEDDFLFLAPSDEVFVYPERKPNHQNDRVWAYSLDDIPENVRVKPKSKYPTCI